MSTAQVEFTEQELLLTDEDLEPLVADGVRCHGGFDETGAYVSPRTRLRTPAIAAWEAQRIEQFGTPILDVALETWPETFPNVDQTKLLLRHDVTEPTISSLTRIGTVEGFGGMLRLVPVPDLRRVFAEDIRGTATDHLARGLFEAHARDEAGHAPEAGHDTMWFLARDLAFDHPVTEDQTQVMLARMGITGRAGGSPSGVTAAPERVLPDTFDPDLEVLLRRMIGLLFIEIAAFHSFRWAEAVLADTDLVAGDGEPARLVSHIRADETPHVSYLRTALSEMRDRTWIDTRGARHDGTELLGRLWDRALRESSVLRRSDNLALALREIEHALRDRPDRDDLLDELFALGSVRRLADGTPVDPGDPRYDDAR
ncbi:MAG: hypothetical protein MUF83_13015 [Acidimicrobiales bacterium]|jgi:hypothetical protein|nr:hypothetical protein [Acidimicrobiales bacterium]